MRTIFVDSMAQNGELLYNGTEKGRAPVRAGNEYGAGNRTVHV